jgi:hypothetical protein
MNFMLNTAACCCCRLQMTARAAVSISDEELAL